MPGTRDPQASSRVHRRSDLPPKTPLDIVICQEALVTSDWKEEWAQVGFRTLGLEEAGHCGMRLFRFGIFLWASTASNVALEQARLV